METEINRVLIVGFGSIGRRHFKLVSELLPEAEVAVLSAQKLTDVRVFSNMDEARQFGPDVVIVANSTSNHAEAAIAFAPEAVGMLVEKPLSDRKSEADRVLEACRREHCELAVGYNLRYLESLKKFKGYFDERIVGEVWSVRAEVGQYLPSWRKGTDYRKSVSASREKGGGVLLELSHEIDYLRWVFGEISSVSCISSHASDLEIDVEDNAHLVLTTVAEDAKSTIDIALTMDFIRHDTTRKCTVIGQSGTLQLDMVNDSVRVYRLETETWETLWDGKASGDQSYKTDTYRLELADFFDSIATGKAPLVSGEAGARVLEIVEAAKKSAVMRSVVQL